MVNLMHDSLLLKEAISSRNLRKKYRVNSIKKEHLHEALDELPGIHDHGGGVWKKVTKAHVFTEVVIM